MFNKSILLLPCLVLGASGCQFRPSAPPPAPAAAATAVVDAEEELLIPIEAELPQRRDMAAFFETPTRVEAENRVEVVPEGMGKCLAVFAEEGDSVERGFILAELDKEELEAQLRQQRVNVNQQKANLDLAERLLAEGLGNKVERDNAQFALEQAQATLNMQEVQRKNQTLVSPLTGIVTRRTIQPGMLVTSGLPAFTIVDPGSYLLPINVPERELGRLKEGQEARVSIDSMPGEEFTATVRRINPSVDAASGTVRVTLDFAPEAQQHLREAAFARVRLVMDTRENALVVPKDAVLEDNTRTFIMIVRPQKGTESRPEGPILAAERIEVKTGLEDGDWVEVESGIEEDMLIVTLGQHTLKEGSKVTVTNAREAIADRSATTAADALEQAAEKVRQREERRKLTAEREAQAAKR